MLTVINECSECRQVLTWTKATSLQCHGIYLSFISRQRYRTNALSLPEPGDFSFSLGALTGQNSFRDSSKWREVPSGDHIARTARPKHSFQGTDTFVNCAHVDQISPLYLVQVFLMQKLSTPAEENVQVPALLWAWDFPRRRLP
jgi:hypothetical protein